jgi:hypothetical protein
VLAERASDLLADATGLMGEIVDRSGKRAINAAP